MPATLEHRLASSLHEVERLCGVHGVSSLEVFGSASNGTFDAQTSDYDFIVRFAPRPAESLARRWVAFSEALEAVLGRPIELISDEPVANPYLRRAIDSSRQTLYVEQTAQALA
jgi:hypothetical protein